MLPLIDLSHEEILFLFALIEEGIQRRKAIYFRKFGKVTKKYWGKTNKIYKKY